MAKILLICVGGFFILVAIALFFKLRRLSGTCTQSVTAKVLGYESKTRENYDPETGVTTTTTLFFAIYEYYVNGERIELTSTTGTGKQNWEIGTEITLQYNPYEPKEIFIPYEIRQQRIAVIGMLAVGIAAELLAYFKL